MTTLGASTLLSASHHVATAASSEPSTSPLKPALIGAAAGGIVGGIIARSVGAGLGKFAAIAGGLAVAGGVAGAVVGAGGLSLGGATNGREVGVAYGRRMIDNGDGTSTWAQTRGTLHLARSQGAREGYATLAEAVVATRPNTTSTEFAYVREGAQVHAYSLEARGLEAVEAFEATDPSVIAYTTRFSGALFAGPGATDAERAENELTPTPAAPF